MEFISCKRIWRSLSKIDYETEFIIKILYAFSTFGLNNKYYYDEAERYLVEGFLNFYRTTKSFEALKEKLKYFEKTILESTNNREYISYLESAKQLILLSVNIEYTKELNKKIAVI